MAKSLRKTLNYTCKLLLITGITLTLGTLKNNVQAQCSSSTASASSPKTADNTGTTITWSQKPTEYVQVTSVTNGGVYKISSSNGSDYFTIKRTSAGSGGTVITTGITPVSFTASATTIYIVVTTNSSCNTNTTARTISLSSKPVITGITSNGCIGSSIDISGTSLSGVIAVSFNGTNAPTFTVNSSTSVSATVPTGATTGTVTVTGPGGTATSSSFTVNPSPSVSVSASPATICSGTISTLTATNSSGTVGTISGSNSTVVAGNGSDPQSVSTSITLASGVLTSLSNITLTVKADHTFAGDVTMTLTSPCGNSTIFNRPGGSSNSDDLISSGNYVFTSGSSNTFPGSSSGAIPTGTYKATFSGISVSPTCSDIGGTWTLTITTASAGNDRVITLTSWSISISNARVYTTVFSGAGTIGSVSYSGTNNTTASVGVTATSTGTYTAITTDGLGCTASNTATVTVNAGPADNAGANQNICSGSSVTIGASSAAGRTYAWSPSTGLNSVTKANPTASPTVTTTYTLTETINSTGCTSSNPIVVTVNRKSSAPASATASVNTICSGSSTILTLNGGGNGDVETVKWYTVSCGGTLAATGNGTSVSPGSTTTYYGRYEDGAPCSYNTTCSSVTITVTALPTNKTVTAVASSVCSGSSTNIQVASSTSGVSYQLRNDANNSNIGSPVAGTGGTINLSTGALTSNTTFNVLATASSCTLEMTNTPAVTIGTSPADNAGTDKSICSGASTTIGASSALGRTYSWSPSTGLSSSTAANPTANPTATTTYTLTETITATGCSVSNTASVTVNPLPADNSGANQAICFGMNGTIGASSTSGRSYKWSPSTGLSSSAAANPTASPTATTTYSLTETITATGCSAMNSTVVTVNTLPTNISPTGTATICGENSVNISIASSQNGINYQLRNNSGNTNVGSPVTGTGGTISLPTGALSSTATFNVLATNSTTSCSLQMSGTVTVTVNASPGDNTGSDKSFCAGGSTTIGASSASGRTYRWSPSTGLSSTTTSNPTAAPTTTTTYTLTETITSTGCSAANSVVVTVNAIPSVIITPSYCNGGGNVQLTSNSFASYLWSTGSINQSITVDRAGTYSVTATSAAGCTGSASYTVAIELVQNGDFESGNTGFTTSYGYTSASGGLYPEGLYAIGSNANYYHSNFYGNDHTTGSGKFMIVNGATSSTPVTVWSESVTLIPNTDYYFSAYAASVNNVSPYAQLKFAVNGVQVGTTAVLTAGPSNTSTPLAWTRFYATWNSGSSTTVTLSIVDLQTAAGGNDFGLDDISCSTLSTVPLNAEPSFDAVCMGGTLNLYSNITGGMQPITYSWSGPNSYTSTSEDATIANASGTLSGIYSITVTDAHGCTTAGSTPSVTVNTGPADNAGSDKSVCTGSGVSIGATSASGRTYSWSPSTGLNSSTSANPTASPSTTTTYTLTETITSTGCSSSNSAIVTVSALPANNTGSNKTICSGSGTTIGNTSTSGRTYSWSPSGSLSSSTVSNPTASPTTTTTYTLTETVTAGGCSTSNNVTVTVTAAPANKTVTASSSTICTAISTNIQVALSVSGVNYQLRNNADNSSVGSAVAGTGGTINLPTGTLTSTTTFNVLATTNSTDCTAQMTVTPTVTVNAKSADPTSATAGSTTICNGSSTTLTLSGGGGGTSETVKWYTSFCGGILAATGNGASVSPSSTTTYYGRYEDGSPCSYNSDCAAVTVTVVAKSSNPTSASASATTICGGSVTLTLNGGGGGTNSTIKWYSGSCGGTLAGTGNNLSVSPISTTTYYGRYEDGTPCSYNTTCSSVTITVSGAPANKTVTAASSTICSGSSTNIQVASSALGVTYQLRNDADNSNIGLPIPGVLGATISLSTGTLSSTTTFNVLATTVLTGCSVEMSATPTVTVNTSPSIAPQPADQSTCAGAGNSIAFSLIAGGNPTPTYQWKERQGSGGYTNVSNGTGGNGATYSGATTNSLTVANPTSAMSGWTYYCVVTNSCSSVSSNAVTLTTSTPGVWNGSSSIDWNDAANWCNGIPTSTTDVTIPSGVTYQPTIAGDAYCHNLTINSGATVSLVTGGDLHLYGNPTINGTYSQTDGVVELVGSSTQTIPSMNAKDVTINNSNGIALSGNLNVSGVLNFVNGKITTGSNEVRVTNTSISAVNGFSSSNYIIGNLRRSVNGTSSYDYPLGTSTKYELINITLSGAAGFNNILGTFTNSNPRVTNPLTGLVGSLVGVVVKGTPVNDLLNYGYWTLTPNGTMTGGSYSVTLNAQGQTNSGPGASSYSVLKRSSVGSSWQSIGTHNNNTQSVLNGVVTAARTGLNTFSDYSIGYGGSVLPIKLISFTAEKYNDDKDVILNWSTAAEINNDHFELEVAPVEHEGDELVFRKIGEVQGNGTTEAHHDYSFIDTEPNKSGIRYYREKQIDFDGTSSYSDIQAVTYIESKVELSDLYPNPVTNILHFTLSSTEERDITISIYNLTGQEVFRESVHLTMGKNMLTFDMNQLMKGFYLFNVSGEKDLTIKQKFEKF